MRAHLTGVRLVLLRLHFYAGLLVGPFALVIALTGLIYTAVPPMEALAYAPELRVPAGAHRIPLADQVSAAQRTARVELPGEPVLAIRPAAAPTDSTRVLFSPPRGGPPEHTVFVNPYTGAVLGTLGTTGGMLPIQAWVDGMHRDLHLGRAGRVYSELAASWLWVLGVSGAVLWVVRARRRRRLRRMLLPAVGVPGRRRLLSWHGAVGLWALVGILLLSGTGLSMTQFAGANVAAIHQALHWTEPTLTPAPDVPVGSPARRTALRDDSGPDSAATTGRVLAAVRHTGMTGPLEIRPARAGELWVVAQTQHHWPSRLDQAAVDPATGAVVQEIRFADWPLPTRLARWTADMHAGQLFGALNRVLLAALCLGVSCLVVWGYRMWWLRGRHLVGWARAPGAALRPTRTAMVAVGVLGVTLGLLLPVLGVSLLGLLLLDSLLVAHGPGSTHRREA